MLFNISESMLNQVISDSEHPGSNSSEDMNSWVEEVIDQDIDEGDRNTTINLLKESMASI